MVVFADLHIHTCLSPCGEADMTPYNICAMAKLKGLQAIAVTDHNSARNLPAAASAATKQGLVFLPGIEITTREEVHLLGYFPTVEKALAMGDFLYARLPDIKNNSRLFGEQTIMNEQDEVLDTERRLLISAAGLSLEECVQAIKSFAGIAVPAHINRGANGLLMNLGFLPPHLHFPALEVARHLPVCDVVLRGKVVLHNSDAHRLEDISEAVFALTVQECSAMGILHALGYDEVSFL